jgi:hypothetical protein
MEFHFIMTVTVPQYNGYNTATFNGTYVPKPGETHEDVYNVVLNDLRNKIGSDRPNVMFFSLERNELSAA